MYLYRKFIKKEYQRLYGTGCKEYHPKHKIGDRVKIERMVGYGIATIKDIIYWVDCPHYISTYEWVRFKKGMTGYSKNSNNEIQQDCESFDKEEGRWITQGLDSQLCIS